MINNYSKKIFFSFRHNHKVNRYFIKAKEFLYFKKIFFDAETLKKISVIINI